MNGDGPLFRSPGDCNLGPARVLRLFVILPRELRERRGPGYATLPARGGVPDKGGRGEDARLEALSRPAGRVESGLRFANETAR